MNDLFRNIILVIFIVGGVSTSGLAQFQDPQDVPKTNSPFSRFGVGDLSPLGFGTIESYGGLYASYRDAYSANIINPASLPWLAEMAFEVGLYAKNSGFKQGDISEATWTGNIDYIGIAFPTKNLLNITLDQKVPDFKHGMSLSLSPYSLVGYDILDESAVVDGNSVEDSFQGKGGTYRFLWGNGFNYKNISVGVNLGYLFGNIEQQRSLTVDGIDFGYATINYQRLNVRGMQWNVGAQYAIDIPTAEEKSTGEKRLKNQIILGVYGNSATSTTASVDRIDSRGRPFEGGFVDVDTIGIPLSGDIAGKMPSEFGFGASYNKSDPRTGLPKLKIGFNFSHTGWSKFALDGRDNNLDDGWTVSSGLEWTPNGAAIKYRQKIRYRIGFKIAKDPRIIQGEQLNNTALTLGLGLPLLLKQGAISFINLSLELGKLNSNNSIDETYGRIGLGFTLNDKRWFLKRKLN